MHFESARFLSTLIVPGTKWLTLYGCPQWVSAREKFQQAANLIDAEQRMKKSMWGQFWSAHQRFFKYLCIASKVHRVVQLAREEVKHGKVGT